MTQLTSNGLSTLSLPAQGRLPNVSPLALLMPQAEMDLSLLDKRRIDLNNEPLKPVTVYSLAGQQICTAGNLTVIAAQAKAGKTAVVGAMLAAALAASSTVGPQTKLDLLGFGAASASGKAVVLFDTEQSPHDAWTLVYRGVHRAGFTGLPGNFRCYSLVDVSTNMRRQFLEAELKRCIADCKGIHSVIIDGIADLCIDPNDPEEAFGLVDELVQLAVKYNCPIIVVLHENPSGADTGKTRGHLGSQLERKAESNLRVAKDGKGNSTIFADRCRRASIPKETGPRFYYDSLKGMHISLSTSAKEDGAKAENEMHRAEAIDAFKGVERMTYTELKMRMAEHLSLKGRTAERRIKTWKSLGVITQTQDGQYRFA